MAGPPQPKPAPRKKARPRPLPYKSTKRRLEADEREHVRLAVIHRDGGCIPWQAGAPGPCGSPDPNRPPVEVHEIKTRRRGGSYVSMPNCIATCQQHHDWVTAHPLEAHELGLVRWSWEDEPTEPFKPGRAS